VQPPQAPQAQLGGGQQQPQAQLDAAPFKVTAAVGGHQPSGALKEAVERINAMDQSARAALATRLGAPATCDTDKKVEQFLQDMITPGPAKKNAKQREAQELLVAVKKPAQAAQQGEEDPAARAAIAKAVETLERVITGKHTAAAEEAALLGAAAPGHVAAGARALLADGEALPLGEALAKLAKFAYLGAWVSVVGATQDPSVKGEEGLKALAKLVLDARPAPPPRTLDSLLEEGVVPSNPTFTATHRELMVQFLTQQLTAHFTGVVNYSPFPLSVGDLAAKALQHPTLGPRVAPHLRQPSAAGGQPVTAETLAHAAAMAAMGVATEDDAPINSILGEAKAAWMAAVRAAMAPTPAAAGASTEGDEDVRIVSGGGRDAPARPAATSGSSTAQALARAPNTLDQELGLLKLEEARRKKLLETQKFLDAAATAMGREDMVKPAAYALGAPEARLVELVAATARRALLGEASFQSRLEVEGFQGLRVPETLDSAVNLGIDGLDLAGQVMAAAENAKFGCLKDFPKVVEAALQRLLYTVHKADSGLTIETYWVMVEAECVELRRLEVLALREASMRPPPPGGGLHTGIFSALAAIAARVACNVTHTPFAGDYNPVVLPASGTAIIDPFYRVVKFALMLGALCNRMPAHASPAFRELYTRNHSALNSVLGLLGGATRARGAAAGLPSGAAAGGGGGGAAAAAAAAPDANAMAAQLAALKLMLSAQPAANAAAQPVTEMARQLAEMKKMLAQMGGGGGAAAGGKGLAALVAPAGGKKIPAVVARACQAADTISVNPSNKRTGPRPCNYCGKVDCASKHRHAGHEGYYSLPEGECSAGVAHAHVKAQLA
jgi:hypothetical protein